MARLEGSLRNKQILSVMRWIICVLPTQTSHCPPVMQIEKEDFQWEKSWRKLNPFFSPKLVEWSLKGETANQLSAHTRTQKRADWKKNFEQRIPPQKVYVSSFLSYYYNLPRACSYRFLLPPKSISKCTRPLQWLIHWVKLKEKASIFLCLWMSLSFSYFITSSIR